jgi:predicted lipoprotein with Yx(FWY)xxD motif
MWRTGRGAMFGLSLTLVLALAPVAIAQDDAPPTVAAHDDAALGSILTDPSGWTLYTFAGDGPETSTCTELCASVWPPVMVDGDPVTPDDLPGTVSAFSRDDGSMQAAYNLAPLYYYSGDAQPGEANGQGLGGSWWVANSGLAPAPAVPPAPGLPAQPLPPAPPPPGPPALGPTARPTPPVNGPGPAATSQPSAPAPTSVPAATPAPYMPPPRPGY